MQNLKESIKEAERKLETIEYNKEGIDWSAPAETNNHKDLKNTMYIISKSLRMELR